MMVIWLVVWNMTGLWLSIQLGMASSQLTNEYIFSEGFFSHQPGNFQLDTEIQVSPVLEELCVFFCGWKNMLNLSCSWMRFSQELHSLAGNMLESLEFTSGWWFQSFFMFHFIYWECHHPNWHSIIFQRACFTRNQPCSSRNQQSKLSRITKKKAEVPLDVPYIDLY